MEKDITCKYWSKREKKSEKKSSINRRHSKLEGKKSSSVIKIIPIIQIRVQLRT